MATAPFRLAGTGSVAISGGFMRKRAINIAAILVGAALALGPVAVAPASAAPVKYANCTALTKAYPNGVAKVGVRYNRVSGVNRALRYKPYYSTAIYTKNITLDRDKDGIACERS